MRGNLKGGCIDSSSSKESGGGNVLLFYLKRREGLVSIGCHILATRAKITLRFR